MKASCSSRLGFSSRRRIQFALAGQEIPEPHQVGVAQVQFLLQPRQPGHGLAEILGFPVAGDQEARPYQLYVAVQGHAAGQQVGAQFGEEYADDHVLLLLAQELGPPADQKLGGVGHQSHETAHAAQDEHHGQGLARRGAGMDVAVAHGGDGDHREVKGVQGREVFHLHHCHRPGRGDGQHHRQEDAQAEYDRVHAGFASLQVKWVFFR